MKKNLQEELEEVAEEMFTYSVVSLPLRGCKWRNQTHIQQ